MIFFSFQKSFLFFVIDKKNWMFCQSVDQIYIIFFLRQIFKSKMILLKIFKLTKFFIKKNKYKDIDEKTFETGKKKNAYEILFLTKFLVIEKNYICCQNPILCCKDISETPFIKLRKKKSEEEKIKVVVRHWTRILHINFGWINEFNKLVFNYVYAIFMFDTFCSSSKLIHTFTGHTSHIYNIDYQTFGGCQLICFGSYYLTVCVLDIDNNKQIQLFNGYSNAAYCVKFSSYHYQNNNNNVICYSSHDNSIRFWDFKQNQQLQTLNRHKKCVYGIEFSSFNGSRYLFSGSLDKTIRLWDVETSKSLHVFNGHEDGVWCIDISPLQSNNNNNIGVIGGNGYTVCSGSFDQTIRMWDIETAKQLNLFKGHTDDIRSLKYGPNELFNLILSGSNDKSVRLWDIRSGQQTQVFNGHSNVVSCVEYSPFIISNSIGNSNVICSGSYDNTIRFWDIRSNKNELYMIKGNEEDCGISCLKFITLKKKEEIKNVTYNWNLCFASTEGPIHIC
ncbi:hypothetical protein RFI_09784 [Reticulomyxa filosa]|uniref:Uncharacterized protein n=1 Tax=Reticulomyxa filosa TaxID=46433 RepID=X6NM51_RETFI|nr:hypothetical protein RFI_09784 [Reticulomyxa filosa]|eukprot:ETO27345.1 hypothetical protein RFI_09784 [Reticulomyxa filosa]